MLSRDLLRLPAACALTILTLLALAGCGDSGPSAPAESQLQVAKKAGEEAVREKDHVDRLERQVRSLKKRSGRGSTQVVVVGGPGSGTTHSGDSTGAVPQTFHAPSGNVSCEILSSGALCTVSSIATTFSFSNGEPAQINSGASLSHSAGELAPYGSAVSAGSITCTIPESSDPHGIICTDADSGHGFEASRVPSRQHVY